MANVPMNVNVHLLGAPANAGACSLRSHQRHPEVQASLHPYSLNDLQRRPPLPNGPTTTSLFRRGTMEIRSQQPELQGSPSQQELQALFDRIQTVTCMFSDPDGKRWTTTVGWRCEVGIKP